MQGAGRTLVMGIVNVTPDSFSDGGLFHTTDKAIEHGIALSADGADLVDVGGESTRPGAAPVTPQHEQQRVIPVVRALAQEGIAVSIDTMHASTAAAAVEAGAVIVNDVSGGLADPVMAATVADLGTDFVAMHWRAPSQQMDNLDSYTDVVAEVREELAARVEALMKAGVKPERIILDPGLGFSKVAESNWPLLTHLEKWSSGHRVLIGASRKRFLGAAIAREGKHHQDPAQREHATTAVTALMAAHGVWAVRVHDAAAARDAIQITQALQLGRSHATMKP